MSLYNRFYVIIFYFTFKSKHIIINRNICAYREISTFALFDIHSILLYMEFQYEKFQYLHTVVLHISHDIRCSFQKCTMLFEKYVYRISYIYTFFHIIMSRPGDKNIEATNIEIIYLCRNQRMYTKWEKYVHKHYINAK